MDLSTSFGAVLIVSPCQYTRAALELLLQGAWVCRDTVIHRIALPAPLPEQNPSPDCPVRAVFFALDASPGADVWGSLLLLAQYLRWVPAGRVVVLAPELNAAQVRFLHALRGVTVWSLSTPVASLRVSLKTWLPDVRTAPESRGRLIVPARELWVLQASVVENLDMRLVAARQQVSRKTVYIQRASVLRRLGVKSLQELLLPDRVFHRMPPVSRRTLQVVPGRKRNA